MQNDLTMKKGERDFRGVRVSCLNKSEIVIVSNARFKLYKKSLGGSVVEAEGTANVEKKDNCVSIVKALISPKDSGSYLLSFDMDIGERHLMPEIRIEVR